MIDTSEYVGIQWMTNEKAEKLAPLINLQNSTDDDRELIRDHMIGSMEAGTLASLNGDGTFSSASDVLIYLNIVTHYPSDRSARWFDVKSMKAGLASGMDEERTTDIKKVLRLLTTLSSKKKALHTSSYSRPSQLGRGRQPAISPAGWHGCQEQHRSRSQPSRIRLRGLPGHGQDGVPGGGRGQEEPRVVVVVVFVERREETQGRNLGNLLRS